MGQHIMPRMRVSKAEPAEEAEPGGLTEGLVLDGPTTESDSVGDNAARDRVRYV